MKEINEPFIVKIAIKLNEFIRLKKNNPSPNNKKKVFFYILLAYFFSAIVLMFLFNPSNCYNTDFTSEKLTNITIYMTIIITLCIYIFFARLIDSFIVDIVYISYSKIKRKEILLNRNDHKGLNFFHALLIILIGFFNFYTLKAINNISSTYYEAEEREVHFDTEITHNKSYSYYIAVKPIKNISSQFDIKLLTDYDTYSSVDKNKIIKLTFRKGILGYVVLDMSKIYSMYNVYKY